MRFVIASIVIVIGLLAYFGFSGQQAAPSASLPGTATSGDLAPDFSLQGLDGEMITLADYRGDKPVVLDFWASWCPNCRRDMPKLNRFYEEYDGDVEVIGVNLQENERTARKYIESAGITFPIVLDSDRQVSGAYGIRSTNTHVLINKKGEVVRVIPGDIKKADIESLLQ